MSHAELRKLLSTERIMAILRTDAAETAVAHAASLAAAGVPVVEVTLTTPGALAAIRTIREARKDAPAGASPVGAGTVLTAADVAECAEAGAEFLVTPGVVPEALAEAANLRIPVVCGAFSATEALTAWRLGAAAVKLFPASPVGPSYLAALRAPLPDIPFVATGGVGLADARAYLAAGAVAVGVGSPLIGDGTGVADRAARFVEALR